MDLVAIDLEGSGAQDRDNEAILEIALVPITDWRPSISEAYTTLINPGRSIPRRPWISPGLTDAVLSGAPRLAAIEPELARRIDGRILVGHNVSVDWRLLHRRCPTITPAGLIDTLRLARHIEPSGRNGLAALVDRLGMTDEVNRLAATSVPHRALWDTTATAIVLTCLIDKLWPAPPSLDELARVAGILLTSTSHDPPIAAEQLGLFD